MRGNFVADHRADVWALGICAIEALTGVHPLRADEPLLDSGPAQMLRVGRLQQAPRLNGAAVTADGRLAAFLDSALAVVPAIGQRQGLLDAAGQTTGALLELMSDA